jgi:hypothetical protein
LFALLLGDVSPDKGTIAIEKNATIGFLPQEPPFNFEKRCQLSSAVAIHSNIAFDFVELKLDGVLHDG